MGSIRLQQLLLCRRPCHQNGSWWAQFFNAAGCDMKEMTCAHHDSLASRTQFVTHTIGRVLGAMDLEVRGRAGLASNHRGRTVASVRCSHIISTTSPLPHHVSGTRSAIQQRARHLSRHRLLRWILRCAVMHCSSGGRSARGLVHCDKADCPSAAVQATDIDTRGYESLQQLVDNTTHDSFELYYGLFMYNQVHIAPPPTIPSVHSRVRRLQQMGRAVLYSLNVGSEVHPSLCFVSCITSCKKRQRLRYVFWVCGKVHHCARAC